MNNYIVRFDAAQRKRFDAAQRKRFDAAQRKRSHPSLFSLRLVLLVAEKESPAQPPCPPRDPDEVLALTLIEKIRHAKPASFASVQIESPQPLHHEMIPAELATVHA